MSADVCAAEGSAVRDRKAGLRTLQREARELERELQKLVTAQELALAGEKVNNPPSVRHEMLHELLGRGDHPAEYFQRRCATIVECNERCQADE